MSDDNDVRIIQTPNLLRAKIGTKGGLNIDQIVAQAEAALDDMKDDYEGWIRDYLASIGQALQDARAGHSPDPDAIAQIRKISHDIKGQGQTFGYPLLTQASHLLHDFIDRDEAAAARNLPLIAAHIDFMNLVVKNAVHDMGGPEEAKLLSALETAAKKFQRD